MLVANQTLRSPRGFDDWLSGWGWHLSRLGPTSWRWSRSFAPEAFLMKNFLWLSLQTVEYRYKHCSKTRRACAGNGFENGMVEQYRESCSIGHIRGKCPHWADPSRRNWVCARRFRNYLFTATLPLLGSAKLLNRPFRPRSLLQRGNREVEAMDTDDNWWACFGTWRDIPTRCLVW